MPVFEILILVLIAGVCGGIGQVLGGGSRGGCLVTVVLGFIGAMIGTWLSRQLDMDEMLPITIGGKSFPILWSIIGAALFVGLLNLIFRRRRRL